MPERITVNSDLNIIEVRSYASVSSEHVSGSVIEVERIHRETGINKVLVDALELTSFPGPIDIYEMVQKFPRAAKIAVLASVKQHTQFNLRFAETVAQNHGIMLHLFESRDEAIEWLKGMGKKIPGSKSDTGELL